MTSNIARTRPKEFPILLRQAIDPKSNERIIKDVRINNLSSFHLTGMKLQKIAYLQRGLLEADDGLNVEQHSSLLRHSA